MLLDLYIYVGMGWGDGVGGGGGRKALYRFHVKIDFLSLGAGPHFTNILKFIILSFSALRQRNANKILIRREQIHQKFCYNF